jgi:uncharacterized protein (TIRG00374 family)
VTSDQARRCRRIGLVLLQLVCLALAIWLLVVPQLQHSSRSLHLLGDIDNGWIPAGVLAEGASLLVFALATRALLRDSGRPALHRVLRIDLSSIALSHCLPGGSAAGTALGWRLLTLSGVPPAEAGFAKVAQGVGSAVVLQALLFVVLVLALPVQGISQWTLYPVVADLSLIVLTVAIGRMLRRPKWQRRLRRALARPPDHHRFAAPRTALARAVHAIEQQVVIAFSDRRRLARAAGWAAANWTFDGIALWASLRAYGHPVSLDSVALAFGVANTIAWLPITPNGLGITEGVMIPMLVIFGCSRSVATLGVLTWRVIGFWLPIPLGAAAYGSLHAGRMRRGGRAAAT